MSEKLSIFNAVVSSIVCWFNILVSEMDEYFESYQNLKSHDIMLKDGARLSFYKQFCEALDSKFVRGKVLLDLGCGTGILALIAAKNGASKVYAVEGSKISLLAEKVVKSNQFANVSVIRGKIEEITLPEKVDVIISEWMGFYLVHEAMLQSVLYARDKFLKPGGILFPERSTLFAAPVTLPDYLENHFSYYDAFGSFNFEDLKSLLWQERLKSPLCEIVPKTATLSKPVSIINWDLYHIKVEETKCLNQVIKFPVTSPGIVHGVALWFSVGFNSEDFNLELKTGPTDPSTHWKQTIVFLPQFTKVEVSDYLLFNIELSQNEENPRWYDIYVEQRNLTDRSFDFVKIDSRLYSEICDNEMSDDENGTGENQITALINALSEKFDADPQELAEIISRDVEANDQSAEMETWVLFFFLLSHCIFNFNNWTKRSIWCK